MVPVDRRGSGGG